jgi:hypothetical protein
MKTRKVALMAILGIVCFSISASPRSETADAEQFRRLLWKGSEDSRLNVTMTYYDVMDDYRTDITFSPVGQFLRADGGVGLWTVVDGLLTLRSIDGRYAVEFSLASVEGGNLKGRIPWGEWEAHEIILERSRL